MERDYDYEKPLPESDLTTGMIMNEPDGEPERALNSAREAAEVFGKKGAHRRRYRPSDDYGTLTVSDPQEDGAPKVSTYDLSGLPDAARAYLAAQGAIIVLTRAEDIDATMADLAAGKVPSPVRAVKVTDWHKAIAAALAEVTKKTPEPMDQESATARALSMTKQQIASTKEDPTVLKHYRKITGRTKTLTEILSGGETAE